MADINVTTIPAGSSAELEHAAPSSELSWDIIELLFFAYRDFVSDPDDV